MTLQSMGFVEGMLYGMGREAKDGAKVLDWEKAASIVEKNKKDVWAGLAEDWEYTSGLIGENGKQKKSTSVYACSRWATPVVVVGDEYDGEEIECWKYATDEDSADMPDYWGE